MMKNPLISSVLYALARGIPMQQVVATIGMPLDALLQSEARLPDRLMAELWRLMVDTFPNVPLGLEMAAAAPPDVLGIVNHVARHAKTLRESLRIADRYHKVFGTRIEIDFVEGPLEARQEYFHPLDVVDYGMTSEMALALAVRFARESCTGPDPVVRVEFVHRPLSPLSAYADHFKVPVIFEAPKNAVVYRAASLELPMRQHNDVMFRFVERHLQVAHDAVLASTENPALVPILDAIAANAERCEYSASALAKTLGVSLRTLQRQVRAEDTSVGALIDQIREQNARALLSDDKLSIVDIAFLLDYSTESAFRRAFKRWTGESPARMRRTL